METIKVCDAILIEILCGYYSDGSVITGYEFCVSPDENEGELRKFVDELMDGYNRPYQGLTFSISKNYPVKKLWTKERIAECIKDNEV
jgi:hypothetical protein